MKWIILIAVLIFVLLVNAMTWGTSFYMIYTYGSPIADNYVIGSTLFSLLSGVAVLIFSYCFTSDIK